MAISRFTVYDAVTRTKIRGFGNTNYNEEKSNKSYNEADRYVADHPDWMFDDTCEHNTAYEICSTCAVDSKDG